MNIQAEVSLYPLRTLSTGGAIEKFVAHLDSAGLDVRMGSMSTRVAGDAADVFDALGEAFATAADEHQVVLTAKFSNACPEDSNEDERRLCAQAKDPDAACERGDEEV